jgi:hypothetical protein
MALETDEHKANNQTQTTSTQDPQKQTNVVGAIKPDIVIDKAPYELKSCDQVLYITAERISIHNDYTSRSSAFFTMSAYLINMFESKDTNKLLESINLGHIKVVPHVLQGSKNCIIYNDAHSNRNITLCISDQTVLEQWQKAYDDFMRCRMGGNLNSFDPVTINNILSASCNGFSTTTGVKYDMPAIRKQMADELRKGGFTVNDQTTNGPGHFGVVNTKISANSLIPSPAKRVNLKVPGTPDTSNNRNKVWD